jgi:transposase
MSVRFVGGPEQAEFMARVRDMDPGRVLLVPVDVGKWTAMAMITDLRGEIIAAPFLFDLTVSGVEHLARRTAGVAADRAAVMCRVGVEAAGHYHRPLVDRLVKDRVEVVELNPYAVKLARSQQLHARQKTDERDLAAIADLLARGAGRCPQQRELATVEQAAWVAHRHRKVDMRRRLRQQIHAQLDLVFPGLSTCFEDIFDTRSGMMILTEICSPQRIAHLGPTRLGRFAANRGIRMRVKHCEKIVAVARNALALDAGRGTAEAILAADLELLRVASIEIDRCEHRLEQILPDTPAAVLATMPGIGVVRASGYCAALGDHTRFPNAGAAYSFAGLSPSSHDSAQKGPPDMSITRAGSAKLRSAILELGRGLGIHHPDFADYRAQLLARHKPAKVTAIAVAHRAHRLAFAMLRDGAPYDPDHQRNGPARHNATTGAGTT